MRSDSTRWFRSLFTGAVVVALAGCGAETEGGSAVSVLEQDLTVGSVGPAVRAVNDYLAAHGYFPNERLASEYPAWRPIVSTPPVDFYIYDTNTENAVRALQHNMGLPQTGIVDAGTREILGRDRCGVPDGIEPVDASGKFAFWGNANVQEITWWLDSTLPSMSRQETESIIEQAMAQWAGPTAHTFRKTPVFPRMRITYVPNLADAAIAESPDQGSDIKFRAMGLNLMLHEIGHTLGLGHSLIQGAVMSASSQRTTLHADDVAAAFARKIGWELFDGAPAVDIAMYNHVQGSDLYVLVEPRVPGGYQIWELHNTHQWSQLPGGAVRIAAMNSAPWIINDSGAIFRRGGGATPWIPVAGCASDIAMGGDGSVWVIGCNSVAGGREIFKWNGSGWNLVPGGAVRISVGPRNVSETSVHVPWVVNDQGHIFRRTTSDPFSGSWELLPEKATDIAVSPKGIAFILDNQAVTGGFRVAIANEQGPGSVDPWRSPEFQWTRTGGAAVGIATDSYGYPYLVNTSGSWWTK